jgi:hypothetical protein
MAETRAVRAIIEKDPAFYGDRDPRQGDGSWLIAAEMYKDANREQTHEGHS